MKKKREDWLAVGQYVTVTEKYPINAEPNDPNEGTPSPRIGHCCRVTGYATHVRWDIETDFGLYAQEELRPATPDEEAAYRLTTTVRDE